jgi:hypothetical protein
MQQIRGPEMKMGSDSELVADVYHYVAKIAIQS